MANPKKSKAAEFVERHLILWEILFWLQYPLGIVVFFAGAMLGHALAGSSGVVIGAFLSTGVFSGIMGFLGIPFPKLHPHHPHT